MEVEEQVRLLAYRLWEEEGKPEGHALEHWLRAIQLADEMRQAPKAGNGMSPMAALANPPQAGAKGAKSSQRKRGRRV